MVSAVKPTNFKKDVYPVRDPDGEFKAGPDDANLVHKGRLNALCIQLLHNIHTAQPLQYALYSTE